MAISAAYIVSVAQQQTVTSPSGSTGRPQPAAVLRAMACRSGAVPQVIAYWLRSCCMASQAVSLIACGAGKSGKPCARFTPSSGWWSKISRVISRITDSLKRSVRMEVRWAGTR